MDAILFTVLGLSVSVKNLIGTLIVTLLYMALAYLVGCLSDDGLEFVPKSFFMLFKRTLIGTALIGATAGVVLAIYALITFIRYCFS